MENKAVGDEIVEDGQLPKCLICGASLEVKSARGRKSGKPFIQVVCPKDKRHFRGFIGYQPYVKEVIDRAGERGSPGLRAER